VTAIITYIMRYCRNVNEQAGFRHLAKGPAGRLWALAFGPKSIAARTPKTGWGPSGRGYLGGGGAAWSCPALGQRDAVDQLQNTPDPVVRDTQRQQRELPRDLEP
jgi:hypothetical protein